MDAVRRFAAAAVGSEFGENVAATVRGLVVAGQADSAQLVEETGLDRATVRRCLLVLVKHNLALVNEKVSRRSKPGLQVGAAALDDEEESSGDEDESLVTELNKKKQAGATKRATKRATRRTRLTRPVYSLNLAVLDMRACVGWFVDRARRVLGDCEADALRLLAAHGRLTPRDFCALLDAEASAEREAAEAAAARPGAAEAAAAASEAAERAERAREEREGAMSEAEREEAARKREVAREAVELPESSAPPRGTEEAIRATERALTRLYRLGYVRRVDPLTFMWEDGRGGGGGGGGDGAGDAARAGSKRPASGDGGRPAKRRAMQDEGNADIYLQIDYGRVLTELRGEFVTEYVMASHGRRHARLVRAMLSRHARDERRHGYAELETDVVAALLRLSEEGLAEAALLSSEELAAGEERRRKAEEEDGGPPGDAGDPLARFAARPLDGEGEDEGSEEAESREVVFGLPASPRLPSEGVVMRYEEIHRLADELRFATTPLLARTVEDGVTRYSVLSGAALGQARAAYVRSSLEHQFGGIAAVRIYNVLLRHQRLEEKQVHDMATVEKKTGREMMYAMQRAGYLRMQEVPTTADRNPSKTIFLWEVEPNMGETTYPQQLAVTWANLRERLERERAQIDDLSRLENRRQLDARQKERYARWAVRRNRLSTAMSGVARLLALFRHLDQVY